MGTFKDPKRNGEILPVAVKVLKRGHYRFDDLVREIKLIDACDHPNIVRLIGYIHSSGTYTSNDDIVMAMEFMNGGDLHNYLINDRLVWI